MRRSPARPTCVRCGSLTSYSRVNRVSRDGITHYICPSCRHDLPTARQRLADGEPPGSIIRSMGIAPHDFFRLLRKHIARTCRGPCGQALPPETRLHLHPLSGEIFCESCYEKSRLPCSVCGRSTRLHRGVIERQSSGPSTFTCRNCRSLKVRDPLQRCTEPQCRTPIGPGLKKACHHPEDPTRRVCETCHARIARRLMGVFPCAACGRTVRRSNRRRLRRGQATQHVCVHCYNTLSGIYEARTDTCPGCGRKKPLMQRHPDHPEERVCKLCWENLVAPGKIVRLSHEPRTWSRPHRALYDAALQRGSSLFSDWQVLHGLVECERFLPSAFELSAEGLYTLRQMILDPQTLPLPPQHRRLAARAISRASRHLLDPPPLGRHYRLLLNRRPLTQPIPAAEVLLDFVEQELPALDYARKTIDLSFYALRRFFHWLAEHHPEVQFLHQIRDEHAVRFQLQQGLSLSAMRHLRDAWRAFAPFATALGYAVARGAVPWEWRNLKVPARAAPVYAEPFAILQALDAFARNDGQPPLDRMLAHLLTLAAPSHEEISKASVPIETPDGVRLVRRSLVASGCVTLPDTSGSRRRRENYRRLASVSLRADQKYLTLYAAVDAHREAVLRGTDCPFVFVTHRHRVCPERPISSRTTLEMLHRVCSKIGFPDLELGLFRNSHALVVAQRFTPRPKSIAEVTGRSTQFAVRLLESTDLDPQYGVGPLPKVALVESYGQPRS